MRVATFNVLHGRSTTDNEVDLDRYAAAVASLDADVLALQEVDRGQPRSHGADLTTIAADAMGAVDHRFVATLTGLPGTWRASDGELTPDAPSYGISLLSRWPVSSWTIVPLKGREGRIPLEHVHDGELTFVIDEPRVAIAAVVQSPAGPVTLVNTHLTFLAEWGRLQLQRLVDALAPLPRPAVLMGDLNLTGSLPSALTGWRPLAHELTHPVTEPDRQIDHILVEGDLSAVGPGRSIDTGVSDHRALVVDIALPAPAAEQARRPQLAGAR